MAQDYNLQIVLKLVDRFSQQARARAQAVGGQVKTALAPAVREVDRLGDELAQTATQANRASRAVVLLGASTRALGAAGGVAGSLAGSLSGVAGSAARAGAAVATFSAGAALALGFKAVKDSAEVESAIARLTVSLENAGDASLETRDKYVALAKELSAQTAFTFFDTVDAEGILVSFGLMGEELKTATTAALDFAAKFPNRTLTEAALGIGKALKGNTEILREAGIEIDAAGVKAGGFNKVIGELNRVVGGAATVSAQTFTGKLENMEEQLTILSARFGDYLTQNKTAKNIVDALTETFKDYASSLGTVDSQTGEADKTILQFKDTLFELGTTAVSVAASVTQAVTGIALGIARAYRSLQEFRLNAGTYRDLTPSSLRQEAYTDPKTGQPAVRVVESAGETERRKSIERAIKISDDLIKGFEKLDAGATAGAESAEKFLKDFRKKFEKNLKVLQETPDLLGAFGNLDLNQLTRTFNAADKKANQAALGLGAGTGTVRKVPKDEQLRVVSPAISGRPDARLKGAFADALEAAAVELRKTYGIKLRSGSPEYGFHRTREQQGRLYANRGNNRYPVAPPGSSRHEGGYAVDITRSQADDPRVQQVLAKYGIARPAHLAKKDPVHFEYSGQAEQAGGVQAKLLDAERDYRAEQEKLAEEAARKEAERAENSLRLVQEVAGKKLEAETHLADRQRGLYRDLNRVEDAGSSRGAVTRVSAVLRSLEAEREARIAALRQTTAAEVAEDRKRLAAQEITGEAFAEVTRQREETLAAQVRAVNLETTEAIRQQYASLDGVFRRLADQRRKEAEDRLRVENRNYEAGRGEESGRLDFKISELRDREPQTVQGARSRATELGTALQDQFNLEVEAQTRRYEQGELLESEYQAFLRTRRTELLREQLELYRSLGDFHANHQREVEAETARSTAAQREQTMELANAYASAFRGVASGAQSLGDVGKNIFRKLKEEMLAAALQAVALKAAMQFGGSAAGGLGGLFGGNSGGFGGLFQGLLGLGGGGGGGLGGLGGGVGDFGIGTGSFLGRSAAAVVAPEPAPMGRQAASAVRVEFGELVLRNPDGTVQSVDPEQAAEIARGVANKVISDQVRSGRGPIGQVLRAQRRNAQP